MSWWWFVPLWVWWPVWLVLIIQESRARGRVQSGLDRLAGMPVWDYTPEERAADRAEVQALAAQSARGVQRMRRVSMATTVSALYTVVVLLLSLSDLFTA